jgi:osmotically-inducible protein OsmY
MAITGALFITATPSRAATASNNTTVDREIFHLLMTDNSLAKGADGLSLTVQNGVVTIKGVVSSQTEKDQLRDAIAKLPGVRTVEDNRLVLQPGYAPVPGLDWAQQPTISR